MTNGPPRVAETHISLLFFVGDRVYKLRKPVEFDFLDFRTRDARRLDCEREVALNRRLAADVYLGVADIEMDGEVIDHMVVMRRMPESRNLAVLARRGEELDERLREVVEVLVPFHAGAARSPEISAEATRSALLSGWEANFSESERFIGAVLDAETDHEIRALARHWTEGHGTLFDERIAAGRVCDGHGDLQAEDVFFLDDGVRILDCVEFCDRLRYVDVIADVAFLAMDLERLDRREAAARLVAEYRELSDDRVPDSLVHYYCGSRAYVRAKVHCIRSAQGVDGAREEARRFHALALDHLRRAQVRLVLVGGLPGTGKSTLAAGLGAARDWVVLRSDEIRAEHGRVEAGQPSGYLSGRYRPEVTDSVYRELLRRAEQSLGSGRSVILDATWSRAHWRDLARAVAERTSSTLVELRCECTPEESDRRIVRRLSGGTDVSDATPEVRAAMSRSADPWASATSIDTSAATPSEALAVAVQALSD